MDSYLKGGGMDEKSSGSQSPILSCVEPLWPPQWPPHILVETRRCKAPQACCDRAGLPCPPDWRAGAQSSHSLPKLGSDLLPGDTNRSDEFQLSPWFPGKSGSSRAEGARPGGRRALSGMFLPLQLGHPHTCSRTLPLGSSSWESQANRGSPLSPPSPGEKVGEGRRKGPHC